MNFNSILIGSEDPQRLADYYTQALRRAGLERRRLHRLDDRLRRASPSARTTRSRQERPARAGSSGTSRAPT